MRTLRWPLALLPLVAFALLPVAAEDKKPDSAITWKKTVIDKAFRSEGVTAADVNKDGKIDIINGEVWYEAPDWKMHEIRPTKDWTNGKNNVYSQSFAAWTDDLNGDGYLDVIVIGFPGAPCYWYENPGKAGYAKHWKQHEIWHSACNETPQYVSLFGTSQRALVMGWQPKGKDNEGQMAYFLPGKDPAKLWEMHPISEPSTPTTYKVTQKTFDAMTKDKVDSAIVEKLAGLKDKAFDSQQKLLAAAKVLLKDDAKALDACKAKLSQHSTIPGKAAPGSFRFSHGLGVGDINGDGRTDVICTDGWWEQPAKPDGKTPWKFHRADLGPACADMYAFDIDGDGKADVLSSAAHQIGIWWHKQDKDKGTFARRDLFPKLVSQTHAMVMADINGDKQPDFVTGKRWWAHGATGDINPNDPATIFWFEAKKDKDGLITFTPHQIDDDSGIGTQFYVGDVNGDGYPDVVTSNKKGTFLLEQVRKK